MTKQEVINRLLPKALEIKKIANLFASMTIAQIVLESGWLKYAPGNNFLGIKVPKVKINEEYVPDPKIPKDRIQKLLTTEWVNGVWKKTYDWFMNYASLEDCMDRYVKILELSRYKQTRESKDWWSSTNYVRINGYATSPNYTMSLRKIILENKLYQYDWEHGYNEQIIKNGNFSWGETFSNVFFNGKKYYNVIEPYPEYWNNVVNLAKLIQPIRDKFGRPIKVESWFRIAEYNPIVGGGSDSQHLIANAFDTVKPSNATLQQYLDEVRKTDATGIGIMKRGLHIDLKKNVKRREWYY